MRTQMEEGGIMMNIREHKFIVFGFEHYNPLGIVRSLGEIGINPDAIIIKGSTRCTSLSKYINNKYLVSDIEEGYSLMLKRYGGETLKPFVFTSDDTVTSFFDERYDELKNKFYFFNAGKSGRITEFMDKNAVNNMAVKHGLNVLPTWVINRSRGGTIPEDIEYPVITKAISSIRPGWKSDVFVCNSEAELLDALKKIKSDNVLVQKYIRKKNELCLDGLSINQGKDLFIAIASNYICINEATYGNSLNVFNFSNHELKKALEEIFADIRFEGIFTVEFLEDHNGNFYFLEINFRNSGWSYASTCVGMNLPLIWAQSMVEGRLPDNIEKKIPNGYKAIAEFQDFRDRVKTGRVSLIEWVKELKHFDCKFLYNKNDNRPFWSEFFAIFIRKFSRLFDHSP